MATKKKIVKKAAVKTTAAKPSTVPSGSAWTERNDVHATSERSAHSRG